MELGERATGTMHDGPLGGWELKPRSGGIMNNGQVNDRHMDKGQCHNGQWDSLTMGRWGTGTMGTRTIGQWDTGQFRHGTVGRWDSGRTDTWAKGQLENWILGHWDAGTLVRQSDKGAWDIWTKGIMGQ